MSRLNSVPSGAPERRRDSHEVPVEGGALFEVRHVSKIHHPGTKAQVRALDDVSLSISAGSCLAFTGPSGSGKSTLLAILGAMERPTHGQVFFQGHDLTACSDVELARVRRRMGFIFQDFALIDSLPVWENITYPLIPRGVARAARYESARSLLESFGMADKIAKRPPELSGGEQQRVAVARALVGQPEVILADEPTSNLDAASATALISTLRAIHASGKTVIVSSHDSELLALTGAVYQLNSGRLQQL